MNCDRFYFWRWVYNIIPKAINTNFWWGTVVHKGCEMIPTGATIAKVLKTMEEVSKKELKSFSPTMRGASEVDLQFEMLRIIMKVFYKKYRKEFKGLKIQATELRFKKKLKQSPILFCGTIDGYCFTGDKYILLEYKTSSQIQEQYFKRLKMDKQLNGYAIGLKTITGKYPAKCIYFTFRKPSIRVRQNESETQYLKRLEEDLIERAPWYYIRYDHTFGRQSIRAVEQDIEGATFDLCSKYDYLSTKELLRPCNWPRNDRACFNWGICQYFVLCTKLEKYKLYLPLFKMRDLRYAEEFKELDPEITIDTRQATTMAGSTQKLRSKLRDERKRSK